LSAAAAGLAVGFGAAAASPDFWARAIAIISATLGLPPAEPGKPATYAWDVLNYQNHTTGAAFASAACSCPSACAALPGLLLPHHACSARAP
jgi:hypothetical protein